MNKNASLDHNGSGKAMTPRDVRMRQREIFDHIDNKLDDDTRSVLLAYCNGPKLILAAALTKEGHAILIRQLLHILPKPSVTFYARQYSRRGKATTLSMLNDEVGKLHNRDSNAFMRTMDEVYRWIDYSEPDYFRRSRLVHVRLEPWGGVTVMEIIWQSSDPSSPMMFTEVTYTFDGAFKIESLCGYARTEADSPHPMLVFPSKSTLSSVPDLSRQFLANQGQRGAAFKLFKPAHGGWYQSLLLPHLIISIVRRRGIHPIQSIPHQYSECEWVFGL